MESLAMTRRSIVAALALAAALVARPASAQDSTTCPPPPPADSVTVPVYARLVGLDDELPVAPALARGLLIEFANRLRVPSPLVVSTWAVKRDSAAVQPFDPMRTFEGHTALRLAILVDTREKPSKRVRFIAPSRSAMDAAAVEALVSMLADSAVIAPGSDPLRGELLIHTPDAADSLDIELFRMRSPRALVLPAIVRRAAHPRFPAVARSKRQPGGALLQFLVDDRGRVDRRSMRVAAVTDPGFAAAALTALPKYEFRPASIGGCAVAQLLDMPFMWSFR